MKIVPNFPVEIYISESETKLRVTIRGVENKKYEIIEDVDKITVVIER